MRYPPSLMCKRNRCAIPPAGNPVPACYDGLFHRPSDLRRHQPASELPRETLLEDLVGRKVMRTEADPEEKQEAKEDNIQRCEEGNAEELEDHKDATQGPGLKAGGGETAGGGFGGIQGDGKTGVSLPAVHAEEGDRESKACAGKDVRQHEQAAVEALVGFGCGDPFSLFVAGRMLNPQHSISATMPASVSGVVTTILFYFILSDTASRRSLLKRRTMNKNL